MFECIFLIENVKNKNNYKLHVYCACIFSWGEVFDMLNSKDPTPFKFGKLELIDKDIEFIAFNRRDT